MPVDTLRTRNDLMSAGLDDKVASAIADAIAQRDDNLVDRPYLDAKLEALEDRFDAKFEALEGRFKAIDARFEAMEARFEAMEAQIDALRHEFKGEMAALEKRMTRLILVSVTLAVALIKALDYLL